MAHELTINAAMVYADDEDTNVEMEVPNLVKTVTTKRVTRMKQNVGTSEEAINLGDVSSPGYVFFVNRDVTNYIDLKVATGGAIFARLDPDTDGDGNGGFALLKLGSGAAVPYAIANTAACQMDIFVCSN